MDCKSARLLLDYARPPHTELEADDAAALESHFADCPDCAMLAHHERRADGHLARAMKAVPIPAGLRARLLRRLEVQRDARFRRLLLRGLGTAAAAAVLLLLLWGGWNWYSHRPQDFDWVRVLEDAGRPTGSPEKVEEWFRENYGIHMTLPSKNDFDYGYLVHYGVEDFSGQRVPVLLFAYSGPDTRTPVLARLYVLTDPPFDLRDPPRGSGPFKVDVLRNPEHPEVHYVLIYTEGAEDRFWSRRKTPL